MAFAASAFVRANSSAAALDIPGSKRSGTEGGKPASSTAVYRYKVYYRVGVIRVNRVTLLTRTLGKLAWHRTPVIRSCEEGGRHGDGGHGSHGGQGRGGSQCRA